METDGEIGEVERAAGVGVGEIPVRRGGGREGERWERRLRGNRR